MNNTVVFAAAGNGKTYNLCKKAKELASRTSKEILIISYTNEGKKSIETEYKKQNLGIIDKNIIIKTWYSFLLSDLIKPYQCSLKLKVKIYKNETVFKIPQNFIETIAFYEDKPFKSYFNNEHLQYYLNSSKDIHKDNVSALACKCIQDSNNEVIIRIEELYHSIFIDELQDYAGWDLELFEILFKSKINIYCVGDGKQATFRTNNSNKNKKYRDDKIVEFFKILEKKKMCTINYANTTRRFVGEVCDYINLIYNDKTTCVVPENINESVIENKGVYIIDEKFMDIYCNYYRPTILRYNSLSNINFENNCQIINYGASKGSTFDRIVIIPVNTIIPFITNLKEISSNQTRSKFYVACTRTKYSIVFSMKNAEENNYFSRIELKIGDVSIPALKYIKK